MAVAQKVGWKLVGLVVIAGLLLLRTSYAQNTSQISVVEEDEQKLLELLREKNFSFEIKLEEEKKDKNQFVTSGISLLKPDIEEPAGINLETTIPEQILKFADFVDQYDPSQKTSDVISFETDLQIMMAQQACQNDFQNYRSTSFNAIGTIRISFIDGRIKYCTGTLIDSKTVITSAECYQKSAIVHLFQPSWAGDTVWLQIQGVYIPDNYVYKNGTSSNFALFSLQEPQMTAPTIGYEIAITQTQQCYITLLGWKISFSQKEYKIVSCPNLPDVEAQLGIKSKNCGEFSCKLDNMGFQTGSPIVLTCPLPEIKHTVIGVLYMREDKLKSNLPGSEPETFAFPYMFNQDDYLDIKNTVKK